MHIILGEDNAVPLRERYTLLELDTIKLGKELDPLKAFCVLENIPPNDLLKLDQFTSLHDKLIENYRKRDWNFCDQALDVLKGKWGGQVDTFYHEIEQRIAKYKEEDPGTSWDPIIHQY